MSASQDSSDPDLVMNASSANSALDASLEEDIILHERDGRQEQPNRTIDSPYTSMIALNGNIDVGNHASGSVRQASRSSSMRAEDGSMIQGLAANILSMERALEIPLGSLVNAGNHAASEAIEVLVYIVGD
ncbi:hypothetical protein MMC25_002612 [Agyrium rufum]|nr:hypothetical protein [Agyrium rufum]